MKISEELKAKIEAEFEECAKFCKIKIQDLKIEPYFETEPNSPVMTWYLGTVKIDDNEEEYPLPKLSWLFDPARNIRAWVLKYLLNFMGA